MNPKCRLDLIGNKKVTILPEHFDRDKVAQDIASLKTKKGVEDAFFTVDVSKVIELFLQWNKVLPRVQPFYAVKCNSDEVLVKVLAILGCGFDVASKAEIDMVVKKCGVSSDRVVYANPCKTASFIRYARKNGVDMMTFDSEEELEKITEIYPSAHLVLRINIGDSSAQCPLSIKFGCDPIIDGPKLLLSALQKGISVVGISFHVGSGCNNPDTFRIAITHARALFDIGLAMGHNMNILDLGGGYPGNDSATFLFDNIVNVISPCLDEFFPQSSDVKIIAEPGRYFACSPFSLITNIIAATKVAAHRITMDSRDGDGYMYYMNDGVYGSFNCILYDHNHPVGRPLCEKNGELVPCTFWGPTCDGLDQVEACRFLPKLSTGDWMLYEDMGAYTISAATTFNGFEKPKVFYFITEEYWQLLSSLA